MKRTSNILRHPATWFVLLVGALAFVPVSIPDADEFTTPETVLEFEKQPIGPENEIIQDFVATGTKLVRVRPRLLTEPVRAVEFQIRLERLVKRRWILIDEKTLLTDPQNNDRQLRVRFIPPIDLVVGERLRMVLRANANPRATLYIRVNPEWEEKGYGLFVNGKRRAGAAVFATNYERTSRPLWRQVPAFVSRITVMMGPLGKTLLILGLCLAIAGIVALARSDDDET